jgi:2,4-dienoyl-CoA reductase-like NADH-dependent reductase (Old Yellow Enzyme family)
MRAAQRAPPWGNAWALQQAVDAGAAPLRADAVGALDTPLALPCGASLPNRLAKAAMTEGLAGPDGLPNERHQRLYRTWARSGVGLQITGNVMVDGDHLERPGNVILERRPGAGARARFRAWADAATAEGGHVWMQISHAGRQTQKAVNRNPKSASDVKLGLPGGQFARPQPLSDAEIRNLVGRFADAAAVARETGFSGVQVHAAHGYLISQFLSPMTNRRGDAWGGSLENRARLLREIVAATRASTGGDFAISVKLNSSDFQKGGFGPDDARQVVAWLEADGVDLIELSGGTYEQPRMLEFEGLEPAEEIPLRPSTRRREEFFLAFASELKGVVRVPLMVTGGFRTAKGMDDAVREDGIAMIGIGRPLCGDPLCTRALLREGADLPRFERQLGNPGRFFGVDSPLKLVKAIASFSVMAWYYDQIESMADGRPNDPDPACLRRFIALQRREAQWLRARRELLARSAARR